MSQGIVYTVVSLLLHFLHLLARPCLLGMRGNIYQEEKTTLLTRKITLFFQSVADFPSSDQGRLLLPQKPLFLPLLREKTAKRMTLIFNG